MRRSAPSPSARFVDSGSVLNALTSLALSRQHVTVGAEMSYWKRGLLYSSGFEFAFHGSYTVVNLGGQAHRSRVRVSDRPRAQQGLLSELEFAVNGKPARVDLRADGSRLLWTGRVPAGEQLDFDISYRGRGLDSFVYKLDPSLPVRDFKLVMTVAGGDNFDYPEGVVSAGVTDRRRQDRSRMGLRLARVGNSGRRIRAVREIVRFQSWF